MAPECSTTGSNAAARPPVMGSLGLPRATRFETTTKFTGRPLLFIPPRLTAVHQYGSCHHFYEMKPKSGVRVGTRLLRGNPAFSFGKGRFLSAEAAGAMEQRARQYGSRVTLPY